MSRRAISYACAFIALSLLAPTAIAAAGDTCLCKPVTGAQCLKPSRPLDKANLQDGDDAGPCQKVGCETWECSEDEATAHCIEKLMNHKLVRQPYTENCIVKITGGDTFLTPYTPTDNQDNKAFRQKPSQYAVKFGANAQW